MSEGTLTTVVANKKPNLILVSENEEYKLKWRKKKRGTGRTEEGYYKQWK